MPGNVISKLSNCHRPFRSHGGTIEIINNTRAGIVIFFRSKKGERAIGGQIQVPDTLT